MRTITTVEELDALPLKTIVMDAHQRGFQKFTNGWEPTGIGQAFSRCATPATVLYEPGEQARPLPTRDELAEAIYLNRLDRIRTPDDWADLDALDRKAWRVYADAALDFLKVKHYGR